MKRTNSQKGQALILIAFGIVALIGFTALAVDGGRVFSDRRNAQNAADTAAMAAALDEVYSAYQTTVGYEQAGLSRAKDNGYENDTDSTVVVEFCDEVTVGVPACALEADAVPSEYIRVRIVSIIPMTFARIVGRDFVTNRVEAISRVDSTPNPPGTAPGAGMFATKMTGNDCYKVLGSANLKFHDSGVFVNCSGNDALNINGSAYIYMDANAQIVGCSDNYGDNPPAIDGTGKIDCNVPQKKITKDTYKNIPTTLPPPTCSTAGSLDTNNDIMYPGNHPTRNLSKNTTFMPGVYCFPSGQELRLIGGSSISGSGLVQIVTSEDISLKGSANNFQNLEIYMTNADFSVAAQGKLTANRMRFFGVGNSSFTVDAQGELISGDIYIYSERGVIDIQAGAYAEITAPPSGDTFSGLLMYMPWDNPNDFILNGGTTNTWRGLILMPTAEVTYNGGAGFELYGQVIAETFRINGNSAGDIYFVSSEIFGDVKDPTIEITK